MLTAHHLYTITGTLTPRPPFDFGKSLSFLHGFGPTADEQSLAGASLTKAVTLHGHAVAFEVQNEGTIEEPRLAYRLYSEQPVSEEDRAAIADRIRFFLSLDDNLQPFYIIGQADPQFAPVIERLYGLHQPKFLTPFEIACWAVLGQRVPWRMAHRTKMALVERWGTSITLQGEAYRAFPEPQYLAAVEPGELAVVVRNERKVEYLRAVIQFFNEVDEQFLRSGPYEEVADHMRGMRGIGEWSVHFILVRGLGRMEHVSSSDQELLKAASNSYSDGQSLSAAALQQMLDRYGTTQGYWAFYARNATFATSQPMEAMDERALTL